ncbi:MAG: ABC transporter permease [Clostridia bacterium]|nr:ABC transporter permease [Clostridia bacterium]
MNKLLKFELRRLFKSKALYICVAFSAIAVFLLAATQKIFLKGLGGESTGEMTALTMLKSLAANYTLLAAIFASIFVTEDYSAETIKNIYSKGFSRPHVFWSKYVSSLIGCMCFVFTVGVLQFFLGLLMFDGLGTAGKNYVLSILTIILLLATYHAIFFAIAIAIRKTGGSIAVSIIGPTGIELLLTLADTLIKPKKFSFYSYWLDGRLVALMEYNVPMKQIVSSIVVALVLCAIALTASFFVNQKRDC